ncbi:MAG: hypothetical protein H6807_11270 [Planctomycetes bacterium]|nr:hypothetical protein [Planctomycetota bacterium]
MQFLLSTGQVAHDLGIPEPRLNDLIRRGKIDPLPPVVAGRRLWSAEHVEAARRALAEAPSQSTDAEATR